ncbi:MAG: hypothetical protein KGZ39_07620 [Simkania sp.]|nr:hypothetical protein [Simkania sp.]
MAFIPSHRSRALRSSSDLDPSNPFPSEAPATDHSSSSVFSISPSELELEASLMEAMRTCQVSPIQGPSSEVSSHLARKQHIQEKIFDLVFAQKEETLLQELQYLSSQLDALQRLPRLMDSAYAPSSPSPEIAPSNLCEREAPAQENLPPIEDLPEERETLPLQATITSCVQKQIQIQLQLDSLHTQRLQLHRLLDLFVEADRAAQVAQLPNPLLSAFAQIATPRTKRSRSSINDED